MHLGNCVGEVLEQREVCRAFAKAPRVPVAGTSTVSTSTGKSQLDLLFLDDSIALRDIDVLPKYSLLIPGRQKTPQEVSGGFPRSRIGVFGRPQSTQMDGGGDWENEVWTDLRSKRSIKNQFQQVGARPWILGRRNRLARGIYNRLVAADRFSGKQISVDVQQRLNALISGSGYSAYQLVFGSNPMYLFGWDDKGEEQLFAQNTSPFGSVCATVEITYDGTGSSTGGSGQRQKTQTFGI